MPSETLHWAQFGGPNKPLSLTRSTVSSATRFVQHSPPDAAANFANRRFLHAVYNNIGLHG